MLFLRYGGLRRLASCDVTMEANNVCLFVLIQETFEKCWAHSPLRAAARRIAIHQVSLSHAATVARRLRIDDPQQQQQRQRVTEGTAMAP